MGTARLIAPSESNSLRVQGDLSAQLIVIDKSNLMVSLAGSSASADSRVRLRLLMRTNTAYELRAAASNAERAPDITVSVGSIHATGSGVIPLAVSGTRSITSAVGLTGEPVVLASGPRISKGPASSPRNAIEIEILLEIGTNTSDGWSRDVLIAITPGAAF
ncbi:MAG TPA: hypothetical protein VFQ92_05405 [Blastocatellia bacterium]|nr:hypothetical protein [Blastocatellia bacterium]